MGFLIGAVKIVPLVLQAVLSVETLIKSKGAAKRDQALALVSALLPTIEGAIGRDVVDDDKVRSALGAVIDAVVELLNVARDVQRRQVV